MLVIYISDVKHLWLVGWIQNDLSSFGLFLFFNPKSLQVTQRQRWINPQLSITPNTLLLHCPVICFTANKWRIICRSVSFFYVLLFVQSLFSWNKYIHIGPTRQTYADRWSWSFSIGCRKKRSDGIKLLTQIWHFSHGPLTNNFILIRRATWLTFIDREVFFSGEFYPFENLLNCHWD